MVPAEIGTPRLRPRRWGLKVWFGAAEPTKEHYEAQIIGARHAPGAETLAIEIGFHAEHRDVAENDRCLEALMAGADTWRGELGPEAEAGGFLGRPDQWRRISETWPDPDLDEDGL